MDIPHNLDATNTAKGILELYGDGFLGKNNYGCDYSHDYTVYDVGVIKKRPKHA